MNREQERVLVVDDEETVRDLLQRVMKEAGYDVVTAANGRDALDKLSQLNAGVVLLDMRMPGMSGMEVLQEITTNWPETCVVMVTAVADTQTAIDAMKLGAYDYIIKPFNRDEVVQKVQEAIEKRELGLQRKHFLVELQQSVTEQSEQMQAQFNELVRTLAREHKLIYELTMKQPENAKSALSRLPPELQGPMSSIEEFSDALLKILRRGALGPSYEASTDDGKDSKQ